MYVQPCGQAAAHAEELVGSDSRRQLSTSPFPSALATNGVDHPQLFEECFAYCARSHPHERQLLNLSLHACRFAYEHRACQIVPAIKSKFEPVEAKEDRNLQGGRSDLSPRTDGVAVAQRLSACWHSCITVEVVQGWNSSMELQSRNGH